jgi:hypothetical protein
MLGISQFKRRVSGCGGGGTGGTFAQTKKKVLTKDVSFKTFLFLIECMSLSNKFEITKKICNN